LSVMNTPLVKPELLSHGTIECSDLAATRRFLTEFLGIDVVRPLPEAQYLWKGGPWSVVCVCVPDSEAKEQGPQNRFKLSVPRASDVDAAHAAALAQQSTYGIRKVEPVEENAGVRSFKLQDLNKHWWEITSVTQSYYDAIFAKAH
jgi:catechol 2,3-dioxygenase-like lactoylglutathione lyase family enzyme